MKRTVKPLILAGCLGACFCAQATTHPIRTEAPSKPVMPRTEQVNAVPDRAQTALLLGLSLVVLVSSTCLRKTKSTRPMPRAGRTTAASHR